MYADKPKPGLAFILLNVLFILTSVTISVLVYNYHNPDFTDAVFVSGAMLLIAAIALVLLYIGVNTEYEITETELILKAGIIQSKNIYLIDIINIERVNFNDCVIGWRSMQKGFCNRMEDGLLITLEDEKIFISPSFPEVFQAHLEKYIRFAL